MKLPCQESIDLVGQSFKVLRDLIIKVVTDLLAEPNDDERSPRDLALVERAVGNLRRTLEGLQPQKRQQARYEGRAVEQRGGEAGLAALDLRSLRDAGRDVVGQGHPAGRVTDPPGYGADRGHGPWN